MFELDVEILDVGIDEINVGDSDSKHETLTICCKFSRIRFLIESAGGVDGRHSQSADHSVDKDDDKCNENSNRYYSSVCGFIFWFLTEAH